MLEQTQDIATPEGSMDTYLARPEGPGPWPVIIFFMDGIGVRPVLREMALRLAGHGYYVALPNLYYRHGAASTLNLEADHNRMYQLVVGVSTATVQTDVAALLDTLDRDSHAQSQSIGCIGYCLGGRCALLSAGLFPERLAAAAAIHGAQLAVDHPDSPDKLAPKMRAKVYVAVAGVDPWLMPGETDQLDSALAQAKVDYTLEVYPDVVHGFAVPGLDNYNKAAAERHWDTVLDLFKRSL